MRIAIISDVHGNIHALDAVLADLDATGPFDEIVYAGDIAFNGAFPSECIDRIRERGYRAVRGNTDEALVEMAKGPSYEMSVTDDAQRHTPALQVLDRWANDRLSTEQIDFLAGWPLRIDIQGSDRKTLTICHATPWSAHVTVFGDSNEDVARQMLDHADSQAVCYGHIHVQYRREIDNRLLCAVGSIGAPFDGDPRAAYAVMTNDGAGWDVEFRRVAYDTGAAYNGLMNSSLPNHEKVAEGVRTGRRNI
ncbi:MAG: metallophosphoesterase family protein [Nitrolancea sp.]